MLDFRKVKQKVGPGGCGCGHSLCVGVSLPVWNVTVCKGVTATSPVCGMWMGGMLLCGSGHECVHGW